MSTSISLAQTVEFGEEHTLPAIKFKDYRGYNAHLFYLGQSYAYSYDEDDYIIKYNVGTLKEEAFVQLKDLMKLNKKSSYRIMSGHLEDDEIILVYEEKVYLKGFDREYHYSAVRLNTNLEFQGVQHNIFEEINKELKELEVVATDEGFLVTHPSTGYHMADFTFDDIDQGIMSIDRYQYSSRGVVNMKDKQVSNPTMVLDVKGNMFGLSIHEEQGCQGYMFMDIEKLIAQDYSFEPFSDAMIKGFTTRVSEDAKPYVNALGRYRSATDSSYYVVFSYLEYFTSGSTRFEGGPSEGLSGMSKSYAHHDRMYRLLVVHVTGKKLDWARVINMRAEKTQPLEGRYSSNKASFALQPDIWVDDEFTLHILCKNNPIKKKAQVMSRVNQMELNQLTVSGAWSNTVFVPHGGFELANNLRNPSLTQDQRMRYYPVYIYKVGRPCLMRLILD